MILRKHISAFLLIAFSLFPIAGTTGASAQDLTARQTETIHNELRALRDRAVAALQARDTDALMAELTEDIAFTAMNNEVVHGKQAAIEYYLRMMNGAASLVEDMSVTIEPDILSNLHVGGQSAVSTGDSIAYFKIRGGLEFTAPLRWTANLVHQDDGWKVASVHFSSNIFDNPVSAGISKYLWLILAAAGIAGLVIGYLLGRLRRA
ncbi:MAG: nuclear transport factor 2 family protein [Oricola sp.]